MDTKPVTIFFCLSITLALLFFNVWCSNNYKELSFEITKIIQQKEELKEEKRVLEIESARLKSPERIEKLKVSLDLKLPLSKQIKRMK